MILLVNPRTGDAIGISRRDGTPAECWDLFRALVLEGWQPAGPRCQAIAATIRTNN